jgi:NAD(P)-dependent dehydrogenase (short-subunit alcohol dehydrogenase family)
MNQQPAGSTQPHAERFKDKVVLCVGAARGMGRDAAERFAGEGAKLAMADINPAVHEELAKLSPSSGIALEVDVRSAQACEKLVATTVEKLGGLDVLAFFSGVLQQPAEVADLEEREWDRVLDVNLKGAFLTMRAAARVMREQRRGRIVAIASDWGRTGIGLFSAYCVSKAGLIVLAQSMAEELAPCGVTVNTVSPSLIQTEMHDEAMREEAALRGMTFEQMCEQEWAKVPMKRAGQPEDISHAVMFLASDEAKYVTGASLDVTGGLMRR